MISYHSFIQIHNSLLVSKSTEKNMVWSKIEKFTDKYIIITTMFFQTSPATLSPLKLVVGGFQSPDQDYTRQVMLFLAICVVYAVTLSIIVGISFMLYGRDSHYNILFIDENRTNILNIRARPPSRWSGPTYRRKTNSVKRRVKSGVKRGFICGINGIYCDDEPSSSEFSDRNNGNNGNFGI